MAKADWCTVAPMSGDGDGTLTISAPAHTGRTQRSTAVTVQNQTGEKPSATIQVIQAGAPVTTTIEANKPDVPKGGATFTISGTSNSSKLTWKLGNPDTGAGEYPPSMSSVTMKVNDVPISSGMTIAGDPGATGTYNFVATVVIAPSPFPIDLSMGLVVTDDTEGFKSCAFTVKAGGSTMSLNKSSTAVANEGGNDTIEVTSNDDWIVS